jgi:hypothetical protein
MDNWLARAMQVACLEREQIEKVQTLEMVAFHIIPNWNIQNILKIPSIKDRCGIPDSEDGQGRHAARVKKDLTAKGWKGPGEITDIGEMHEFDWTVFNNAGQIVWDHSGGRKSLLAQIGEGGQ